MAKRNKQASNRPEESLKQAPGNIQEGARETLGNERTKRNPPAEQPQGQLHNAEETVQAPELTSGDNR